MTLKSSEGLIATNWYSSAAQTFDNEVVLFSYVFRGDRIKDLFINSELTSAESYRGGSVGSINLEVRTRSIEQEFALYQNSPNPFIESTLIGFDLPNSDEVTMRIYTISGQEIFNTNISGVKGHNEYVLRSSDLKEGISGVLYYRIETDDYSASKKMIIF